MGLMQERFMKLTTESKIEKSILKKVKKAGFFSQNHKNVFSIRYCSYIVVIAIFLLLLLPLLLLILLLLLLLSLLLFLLFFCYYCYFCYFFFCYMELEARTQSALIQLERSPFGRFLTLGCCELKNQVSTQTYLFNPSIQASLECLIINWMLNSRYGPYQL